MHLILCLSLDKVVQILKYKITLILHCARNCFPLNKNVKYDSSGTHPEEFLSTSIMIYVHI